MVTTNCFTFLNGLSSKVYQCGFILFNLNSDGKPSSMCGNGARCLVQFAYDMGIHKNSYKFIAVDGEHEAEMEQSGYVNLKMNNVNEVTMENGHYVLNTGSPHYIKPCENVKALDVFKEGRNIRYSNTYKEKGINVNFVEQQNDRIFVRTYERGVEDETLSCGTGVTASALMFAHNDLGFNRIEVETLGGRLAVEFEKVNPTEFKNIWLCGPATFVFKGEIELPFNDSL